MQSIRFSMAATVASVIAAYVATSSLRVVVLSVIVVAMLVLVILIKPRVESLLIVTVPVTIPLGGFNGALSDFLIVVGVLCALSAKSRDTRIQSDYFWFSLALLAVLTTSVASLLGAALSRGAIDFGYGIAAPVKLAIGFVYLFVFYALGRRAFQAQDYTLFRVWKTCAQTISCLSVISVLAWSRGIALPFNTDFRATGLFADANLFAAYLLLSVGVTLASNRLHGSARAWRDINVLPLLAALVLTGSRAVLPAVAVGLLALFLVVGLRAVSVGPMLRLFGVAASGLLGLIVTSDGAALRLDAVARFQGGDANAQSDIRLTLWRVGIEMGSEHPFLGIGIGQFRAVSPEYFAGGLFNLPHNTYIGLFAETGVLGLVAFLIVPVLGVYRLRTAVVGSSSEACLWLLSGLFVVLAQAFTLNLENTRALWAVLGLSIALGSTLMPEKQVGGRERDGKPDARPQAQSPSMQQ